MSSRMLTRRSSLLFVLPLLACAACSGSASPSSAPKPGPIAFVDGPSPPTTSGVATADLFPSMSVRSDENGIHVVAALIYPAGHFLELGDGDSLTATVGGVTRTLEREANDDAVHYATVFPVDDAATSAVVSFRRSGGQPSAPNNVVPIAPAFRVTAPKSASAVQEGALGAFYSMQLDPAPPEGHEYALRVGGACVPPSIAGAPQRAVSFGDGQVVADINRLLDPTAKDCTLYLELRDSTQGTWDPAFDTDSKQAIFEGAQARVFTTIWNPSANGS